MCSCVFWTLKRFQNLKRNISCTYSSKEQGLMYAANSSANKYCASCLISHSHSMQSAVGEGHGLAHLGTVTPDTWLSRKVRAPGGGLYVQRRKERGRRRELSVLLLVLWGSGRMCDVVYIGRPCFCPLWVYINIYPMPTHPGQNAAPHEIIHHSQKAGRMPPTNANKWDSPQHWLKSARPRRLRLFLALSLRQNCSEPAPATLTHGDAWVENGRRRVICPQQCQPRQRFAFSITTVTDSCRRAEPQINPTLWYRKLLSSNLLSVSRTFSCFRCLSTVFIPCFWVFGLFFIHLTVRWYSSSGSSSLLLPPESRSVHINTRHAASPSRVVRLDWIHSQRRLKHGRLPDLCVLHVPPAEGSEKAVSDSRRKSVTRGIIMLLRRPRQHGPLGPRRHHEQVMNGSFRLRMCVVVWTGLA